MMVVTRLATERAEKQVEAFGRTLEELGFDIEVVGMYPAGTSISVRISSDEFDETRMTDSAHFCGAFGKNIGLEPSAAAAVAAIKGLVPAVHPQSIYTR
jgi:hypothetical protein